MESMDTLFNQQKQHAPKVARSTVEERILKLRLLEQEILKRQEQITQALHADFRKPELETNFTETFLCLHEIRHTIRHLAKWMRPERVSRTLLTVTARSEIRHEPKGVVLIISPWNFPIHLAIVPLISAVAAGNCAIVKPSEFTANSSKIIAEIIAAVFQENEIAVVQGDKDIAIQLLQLPFNHIFFTGSSAVGKIIMKAAAEH
ncbi:MAG: aldehyde dehydrogenase family protein, partial [Calditrichaeota bacterium]